MHTNQFLLYGANGYTAGLIMEKAEEYGLQPVLAGRNKEVITALSAKHRLPYRIAHLDNKEQLDEALTDITVVLNAAGPFKRTAVPLIEACIKKGVHYLDITGEIPVFETAKSYNQAAITAGIMVMPGAGFDVVPTDCLALFLKDLLPDATHLKLAFTSLGGGLSHGTAITMTESLGEGGAARENGKIVKKPLGEKGMWVDFGSKRLFVMSIPWGDVSTAYTTTGIPNIETYTGIDPRIYKVLKAQFLFNWLLRTGLVRNFAKKTVNNRPAGPSAAERQNSKSLVWGEVTNNKGEKKAAILTTPDGYTLTAHTSLIITKKILNGDFKAGYQTPAGAYGADLVLEVSGTSREVVF